MGTPPARLQRRRNAASEDAVAEVVGSILLVSIVVVLSAALSLVVMQSMNPVGRLYVDVGARLDPGDATWGNGNERIIIDHRGGQALTPTMARFVLTLGDETQDLRGDQLGSAFDDGRFNIGESWIRVERLASCTPVHVQVIVTLNHGATQLLHNQVLTADAANCEEET
jgi:hypothetical protein